MKRGRTRAENGFTLLEVLLATVVLAATFVAVMSLLSQSLGTVARLEPHQRAWLHAREKMSEVLLREELELEQSRGAWPDGYQWDVEITPYRQEEATPPGRYGLFVVRVQVSWGEAERTRSYAVETVQLARQASGEVRP